MKIGCTKEIKPEENRVIRLGLGADVTTPDISLSRLTDIDPQYAGRVRTLYAFANPIEAEALGSDDVVAAVLVSGKSAHTVIGCSTLSGSHT